MNLVCPRCKTVLDDGRGRPSLHCANCGRTYPIDDGIADFAEGRYYDSFDESTVLSVAHRAGLENEMEGTRRRILDYYEPLIRRLRPGARTILDCGCGNGLAVDVLSARGYEAWGNDLSQLRKWQWRERERRERLVVADGSSLPFPDGSFDAVIASGVIEHIGVDETAVPRYAVVPRASRDGERRAFLRELVRVTAPRGLILLDTPNGAFPIDFWHGDSPGGARRHAVDEGFLPTSRELRALVRDVSPSLEISFVSPYKRLQFLQASRHWYGRVGGLPVSAFFRLMTLRVFRRLASTRLNPFLVAAITKQ